MISRLEKLPIISFYAKMRGWHFIIAWCHRITGLLLLILVWLHIYSFSSPYAPGVYDGDADAFGSYMYALFRWILAIPIIFHAFNGGRLILYESFGNRNDDGLLRWMLRVSIVYVAILGLLMLMGNQRVSPFLFWLITLVTALILTYGVAARIRKIGHSVLWKFQRISGTFLLVMVPAYILFMHLGPTAGREVNPAFMGMQDYFIKACYLGLLGGALYHGGYGLWSLVRDYLSSRILRVGLAFLVTLIMLIFGWVGLRLALAI